MKNLYNFLLILCSFFLSQNGLGQTFLNASFETWGDPGFCSANTVPDDWESYSNGASEADKSDYTICPHTIPGSASDGNVSSRFVSFATDGGEGVYQDISGFTVGEPYVISFDYAGSNQYGGTGNVQFHLFIDDVLVESTPVFSPTKDTWSTLSYGFTPTSTTHKIGIRLYISESVSGEAEADNFSINSASEIIQTDSHTNISVYPNPVHNELTISSSSFGNGGIYDLTGKVIMTFEITPGANKVSTKNLPEGIYFVRTETKNGVITKKICKK